MSLKICIAQFNYCVGDMAGNARLIIAAARQAYEAGARLVLTPELAICGYAAEDLFLRPAFVQACDDAVNEVARELAGLKGLHVVVGIIPQALVDKEYAHRGCTELHIVADMHERKHMMAERADAFLALPGGIGTLEEFFEVWTWRQLGYHNKPVGLLNLRQLAGVFSAQHGPRLHG